MPLGKTDFIKMLCSVAIASRFRFDQLLKCVRSVFGSASSATGFEVVVRLHLDDKESCGRVSELLELQERNRIQVIYGETRLAYFSLSWFYKELMQASRGHWMWHLNDDMIVQGENWNDKLAEIPLQGFLVQPEFHFLNQSLYRNDPSGSAPIHPRTALGNAMNLESPEVDKIIYNELVNVKKWQVKYLEGITVWHQWGGIGSHAE